jgi:hypothetical protein
MTLPTHLIVSQTAIAMDGGTRAVLATDDDGKEHTIVLVQHGFPHRKTATEIPGRLYFDRELIPMRSDAETEILALLHSAEIGYEDPNLSHIIQFVESAYYLRFAERVEQAADPTRYTLWLVSEPSARNRTIVKVGKILGIGMKAAREFLDSGKPIQQDLLALGVIDFVQRFENEGLQFRIEPAFPWRWPSFINNPPAPSPLTEPHS